MFERFAAVDPGKDRDVLSHQAGSHRARRQVLLIESFAQSVKAARTPNNIGKGYRAAKLPSFYSVQRFTPHSAHRTTSSARHPT
ncbi:hypothetical protein VTN00DRAFT_5975 [Thermoascus crustaceus]|uniref:uncharacterized protein n=1 Tax=Thermoascus crustaceus TaxID=5088 RepID=UPI0037444D69